MKNIDSFSHVRGESIYVDDIPVLQGTLYCALVDSRIAHGKIRKLDITAAAKAEGVVRIFTYKDIPGENQIGGIIPDEPLLAEDVVDFQGMPIALVVAETEEQAKAAAKLVVAEIDPLPVVTDPREAAKLGKLIIPPRTFRQGEPETAWKNCTVIVEGVAESGGQEHLYIETQGAYVIPLENGKMRIWSSTQGPTAVQRTIARVLGVGMHAIEVDVTRLGGGFGGKEDQATTWAALAALAVYHLKKPVKYVLDRMDDMRMTGKRHPYSSDYKLGFDADMKIVAFEATLYQDAGAAADLSPAVMERSLFHSTNTYFVPNSRVTAFSCKTNVPPNTAFRGFGGPQGMFVIESAIAHASEITGIPVHEIQRKNLLVNGNTFQYGQVLDHCNASSCWDLADQKFDLDQIIREQQVFNSSNHFIKRGVAVMPICFGISFTKTLMNQARALVHVYSDGSVGVSTGAVEMGQGVNTKMLQVAARVFSIRPERVRIESTNTTRVANTSPSAASATADLNGKATELACQTILKRLINEAAKAAKVSTDSVELRDERIYIEGKPSDTTWKELVTTAFVNRVNLSESGHYATPEIHFDPAVEKGHPFAYHVYGTAIITTTVDCLRGIYEVDAVKVVHDFGKSMNPTIDIGQIEGGIVQGIGWMTLEELAYNKEGRLLSNALSTYKVPDIYSVPKEMDIVPLETDGHHLAILGSKAVGEPPLMYGIGAYFSLRSAVKAFNPKAEIPFSAPMTPEKVLMSLYPADGNRDFQVEQSTSSQKEIANAVVTK